MRFSDGFGGEQERASDVISPAYDYSEAGEFTEEDSVGSDLRGRLDAIVAPFVRLFKKHEFLILIALLIITAGWSGSQDIEAAKERNEPQAYPFIDQGQTGWIAQASK